MTAAFLTILPIFATIMLGWGATQYRFVEEKTGESVSDYVFVIAIPLLMFRTLATSKLPDLQPWPYWLSYFIALAVVWIIATSVTRRAFARDATESVIVGFSSAQANTVLIGIPLLARVFGDVALVPLVLLLAVHTPITITAATLMVEKAGPGTNRSAVIFQKLIKNPLILGIAAGSIFRLSGFPMPDPALAFLKLVGDSAAPCALFAMGAALTRYGLGGEPRLLAVIVFLKLIAFPSGVYLLATWVFPVPPAWVAVGTLLAACPCGVNAYLLAQRYNIGVGLTSGAIAASTVLSVVTLTFWVWLVSG